MTENIHRLLPSHSCLVDWARLSSGCRRYFSVFVFPFMFTSLSGPAAEKYLQSAMMQSPNFMVEVVPQKLHSCRIRPNNHLPICLGVSVVPRDIHETRTSKNGTTTSTKWTKLTSPQGLLADEGKGTDEGFHTGDTTIQRWTSVRGLLKKAPDEGIKNRYAVDEARAGGAL